MKALLLGFVGLCVSCLPSERDLEVETFAPDTVHVIDGLHVKLMKFDRIMGAELRVRATEKDYRKGIHSFAGHGVDLGMADVPVLDQGQYGTCVTFASTAALDALLERGDFVSQQCSLELDTALGDNWWDGAYYPSQIIVPLQDYGVVEKSRCDNQYAVPYVSIQLDTYKALVDADASDVIKSVEYEYFPKASLPDVKRALDQGKRVLTGFLIKNVSQAIRGFDVKVDGVQYSGGLWACKQGSSSSYCGTSQAGHEVVIVGYDDDQELLKIRNSWSEIVGEQGTYYMSYAFFSAMAIDQTAVW